MSDVQKPVSEEQRSIEIEVKDIQEDLSEQEMKEAKGGIFKPTRDKRRLT